MKTECIKRIIIYDDSKIQVWKIKSYRNIRQWYFFSFQISGQKSFLIKNWSIPPTKHILDKAKHTGNGCLSYSDVAEFQ